VSRLFARLWPKSLAVRLTLLLVVALAVAQIGLTLLLSVQRDSVVEGLLHSQALNQTVTLARLLNEYPAKEAERLTEAFGSRQSCAAVLAAAPATHVMTAQEQELSQALEAMLHGIKVAPPQVVMQSGEQYHCDPDGAPADHDAADRDRDGDNGLPGIRPRAATLTMDVALLDGRWLSVRTAVNLPDEIDRATILSFLLSSVAVALVAGLVVRRQTRSLRTLATASDRFGRGEQVAMLPLDGPSEVNAATHAFNVMQERLSQFIRDRMRLLASVSHDLRTPLTTLRLKAEFIDDEAVKDDLVATIDELTVICEATLAFTRAEATTEETRILDLTELVREVTEDFRLAGKDVDDVRFESIVCPVRPVALKRAVRNLVENAVRYGGTARVSVFADAGQGVIAVEDDGPGIPDDRIGDAFQPFVRLEPSRSSETGGIGLGLTIAHSIVNAHGGELTLANRVPHGLRAEIRLPTATARQP
jgi:signal transduction histidine kinase